MHLPDAKECIKGSRQHHGMSNTTPGLIVSVDQDVLTGRLAGAAATFFRVAALITFTCCQFVICTALWQRAAARPGWPGSGIKPRREKFEMESMGFVEGLLWLTLNIYHEARSEPEIGKLAVAHVTLNRAMEEQKSIEEVVTAPYQFSWTFQKTSFIPAEPGSLEDSMGVALKAITSKDFTQGSTFYHRTDVSPRWAAHKNFTAQYGSHKFYRQAGASVPPLPF